MKRHIRFVLLPCVAAGAVAGQAFAGKTDLFLEEVSFVERGQGASNALVMVEERLAGGGLATDDRARLVEKQVALLAARPKANRPAARDRALYARALSIAGKEIMPGRGIDPGVKLRVLDSLAKGRFDRDSPSPYDYPVICLCETALRDPAVRKDEAACAGILVHLADRHYARGCKDLALDSYREAASHARDPVVKAGILFRAATAARDLRDLAASNRCLDEILETEALPYRIRKKAILFRGENAIYPDEHSWSPGRGQLDEARAYVGKALDDRSPLLGTDEAGEALVALVKAEAKAGNVTNAVEMGKKILDGKGKLGYRMKADLAVFIADTLHGMGDYKGAVKFYERGLPGGDIGPKNIHKRIAASARAGQDFLRAMQAYNDAIKFCDPVEGKDEIAHLTNLIRQMNKTVRKGTSSFDAEKMFIDTKEEIGNLTLDEE